MTSEEASSRNVDELKRLVISAMDKNGALAQLRSTVKLHVAKIINNEEIPPDQIEHKPSEKLLGLIATERGQLLAELIADFLQTYELKDTLSMFLSEANMNKSIRPSGRELASLCRVPHSISASVLEQCLMGSQEPQSDESPLHMPTNISNDEGSPQVYSPPDINPNTSLENDMHQLQGISEAISNIVEGGETSPFPSANRFSNPIDDNVLFESRDSFKDLMTSPPLDRFQPLN